jgi:hypothetical protein
MRTRGHSVLHVEGFAGGVYDAGANGRWLALRLRLRTTAARSCGPLRMSLLYPLNKTISRLAPSKTKQGGARRKRKGRGDTGIDGGGDPEMQRRHSSAKWLRRCLGPAAKPEAWHAIG